MTNLYRTQRKLMRQAQAAFILTYGAQAFWLWSRYLAWLEGWEFDEETVEPNN